MNRTNFLVTLLIALFAIPAFAEHPTSFSQAKRFAREIYQDNQSTFYCGCSYDNDGAIDSTSCGYEPRKQPKRGERLEWSTLSQLGKLAINANAGKMVVVGTVKRMILSFLKWFRISITSYHQLESLTGIDQIFDLA